MQLLSLSDGIQTFSEIGFPLGSPEGLVLSNNAANPNNVVDISAGRAIVATDGGIRRIVSLLSFSKNLNAQWQQGSGNGGLQVTPKAANTTYHVHIICQSSTGVVDVIFSTSMNLSSFFAPDGSGVWHGRLIGSVLTDASGNVRQFVQTNDKFQWMTAIADLATNALPTTTTNRVTLSVPSGLKIETFGVVNMRTKSGQNATVLAGDPNLSATETMFDISGVSSLMSQVTMRFSFCLTTNTSRQVAVYAAASANVPDGFTIFTQGFYHPRGA